MGVEIHRSVLSWATVNRRDVQITSMIVGPLLLWSFAKFVHFTLFAIPMFLQWIFFLSLLVPIGILCYEPALLVFPTNIITSLLLRNRPADLTNEKDYMFPMHGLFEYPTGGPAFHEIQKELLNIQENEIPKMKDALPNQHYIGSEEKWRYLPIRTLGCTHLVNANRVPILMRYVQEHSCILTIALSQLNAGGFIPPHAGYFKGIVRYHLGISIPEPNDCFITVNGKPIHWQEGQGIMFDDMYLHSVVHKGTKPRVILWFDILRPELNHWPILLWWTRLLVKLVARSKWMAEANRKTETVLYNKKS